MVVVVPITTGVGSVAERMYEKLRIYSPGDDEREFPLRTYLQGLGMMIQPLDDVLRQREDGRDGITTLLDPDETPDWALNWLAMFPGVTYPKDITAAQKRQLLLQTPAQDRGSETAIVGAARLHLADPATSRVFMLAPCEEGNCWKILVVTKASETPDPAATERDLLQPDVLTAGVELVYASTETWLVGEAETAYKGKTVADFETDLATINTVETHGVI